jgi:hypothetical protein
VRPNAALVVQRLSSEALILRADNYYRNLAERQSTDALMLAALSDHPPRNRLTDMRIW